MLTAGNAAMAALYNTVSEAQSYIMVAVFTLCAIPCTSNVMLPAKIHIRRVAQYSLLALSF